MLEKMTSPTSASQRMASSLAFLKIPFRRLENVTCRLVELSIRRMTILPRPILKLWPILQARKDSNGEGEEESEMSEPNPKSIMQCGFFDRLS